MTTSRDKISATLDTHRRGSKWACNCGFPLDEDMPYISHQSHVVDELVKVAANQQVTTPEELEVLPVDSVVRDSKGFIYDKWPDEDGPEFDWWATTGDSRQYSSRKIALPATVLQHGAVTA